MASRAIEPLVDGLEGVIVAETMLSRVDGALGRLVVRGHDVESLAGRVPFEGVCSLLWTGELEKEPAQLRSRLGRARQRAFAALSHLGDALENPDGMEALRTAVAHLRIDPVTETETGADEQAERVAITGAVAVFVAAWARRQLANAEPVAPDPSLSHAADTLRMIAGSAAGQAEVAALDAYLTTVAEHGMNASTFTARVVASTGSDTVSAVVAAVGALKGPLHGGVPGPVLEMLDSIATPEAARAWLEAELAAGRRIMGMGHRVYRVRDPRAAVFEQAVERLAAAGVASRRLDLARAVEREARALLRARYPDRPLEANVEFYTAVLLDAVGLHPALFTPIFAVARVAGWLGHIDEQRKNGRLIRPVARYIGPLPQAA